MGRMLEAMKRIAVSHAQDEVHEVEAAPQTPAEPAGATPDAEEVPYIEVGGRGIAVDASPSVLVAPRFRPSLPVSGPEHKQRLDPYSPRSPVLAKDGQRGVSFRVAEASLATRMGRVAPEIISFHDPTHPVSEQYRTLLGQIQETLLATGPAVLLFTAVAPGAGTTTTLLNLAVTCGKNGKQRVVVVDANLVRPALAKRLGVVPAGSMAEVLSGTAALEQVLAPCAQPHLHVLGAAKLLEAPGLLGEENVRWLAARLRERFDVVLVDGPVWESTRDTAALANIADAVYLVVEAADADTPPVRNVTRTLAQRGWRLGGLILGHQGVTR